MQQKITPYLWFAHEAEEAARFYVSLLPGSRVVTVDRTPEGAPGPAGGVMAVTFELAGQRFVALNGRPPSVSFTDATSLHVACEGQGEVDRLWERLLAGGGQESMCGWLKDRFGVSWQIIPEQLPALLADKDPARAGRAMKAMLTMRKIDIAQLERAAGTP